MIIRETVQIRPTFRQTGFFHRLLIKRTDNTLVQLFRYTFVGGAAFAVDFGSLYALTEFAHVFYLWSAAVAFMLGLLTNYIISVVWVFNSRMVASRLVEFAVFAGVGVVGLVLNELIMWTFTERLGLHYLLSKIIATFAIYAWNFFGRKFLLFQSE